MGDLEKVVKAFDEWRRNRVSKNQPTPDRLWAMVKELTPHYKKVVIQRALRVSGSQFNERVMGGTSKRNVLLTKERSGFDEYCLNHPKDNKAPQIDGFVSGFIERATNKDAHDTCELTLQGLRKSLQLKVSIKQLPEILSLLEGYL